MHDHPSRRAFISQLGIASAAVAGNQGLTLESPQSIRSGALETWDMSWLESLKTARYRAVVDVSTLEDGYGLALAAMLMDQIREVHGVRDEDVKIVLVHRRGGTPIVLATHSGNASRSARKPSRSTEQRRRRCDTIPSTGHRQAPPRKARRTSW